MIDEPETHLIDTTINFVKTQLANAEGGHDWYHIERVWNVAKTIASKYECNKLVVELGALLHDIADSKFYNGDETVGPKISRKFLMEQRVDESIISQIDYIIRNVSFKNRGDVVEMPIELQIIQDADRIDALGAIGIARCFNFGGFKGNPMHIPGVEPNMNQTKQEYKKSNGTSINHFYEKLFLLKDMMNTKEGRLLAVARHEYMEGFVKQFMSEWNGVA
jgi:uncharacterized protein